MNAEMHIEPVRKKVVWGSRTRLAVALAGAVLLTVGALLLTSCSQAVRTGQASSYLILTSLQSSTGSTVAQSDVRTVDPTTGASSVVNDVATAAFELQMK